MVPGRRDAQPTRQINATLASLIGARVSPSQLRDRFSSSSSIHPEDTCDPVTFGALCNPNFHGTTTVAQFNAELDATQRVATWEYGGGQIQVSSGRSFQVDNRGGETHTFTVVAQFGGGRVPVLNQRSGK